jgi:phosphoglycolate phosphatase-like HAD superfamily hydrolase
MILFWVMDMEKIKEISARTPVHAVLFDFDGTISTLRCGWETVMKPLMLEMISGGQGWDAALEREVDDYINESTGIQTIHQMKWLAETVKARGMNPGAPEDPWWYKGEYNRRLMENVGKRVESVKSGLVPRENYMIRGSEAFLKALRDRGVKLYVASGTDHPDVMNEVAALGLNEYFTFIAGAPVAAESCSKEKVIADLMENEGLSGADFAVIGDGKVEIRLGAEAGARTVGLASDEEHLCGVNPVKRERLIKAGADVICGDFNELDELLSFLGL